MNTTELKQLAENQYNIIMAACRIQDAADIYEDARKEKDALIFDYTLKDHEGNARYIESIDKCSRLGGQVKKAVNAFFKVVGESKRNYEFVYQALEDYQEYINQKRGFYYESSLLADLSKCNLSIRVIY